MKKWKELAEKSREAVEEELRIDVNKRRDSLIQIGEDPDQDEKTDISKTRESGIQEENESSGSGADDGGNTEVNKVGATRQTSGDSSTTQSEKDKGSEFPDDISTDEEVRQLSKELHS